VRVRAGALVGAGVLERAFAAPTFGVVGVGRYWSVALDLAVWPRGFAAVPGRTREGSRLALTTATVLGCGRWGRGRFAIAGCGGPEVGVQSARGIGLEDPRSYVAPSFALVVAPQIEVALTRLVVLSIAPWVRFGLVRPGVRIDGVGEVWRALPFSGGGALRIEVRIPGRKARARGI
jgi:hypothetical protein